jgi:type I restriction enzyme M protein
MNADEFRDYMLGFIFYKYLSEKIERFADGVLEGDGLKFAELTEDTAEGVEIVKAVRDATVKDLGYFLSPSELFKTIALKGSNKQDTNNEGEGYNFILEDLTKILKFPMYKPKENFSDLNYILYFFLTDQGKNYLELASPSKRHSYYNRRF